MKKMIRIILFTVLLAGNAVTANQVSAQSASVSFSVFHNSLSRYGRWVNHGTYGQVWVSNTRGFKPYQTGGHWTYTDYGWTWVSDYDWGWAPFHYGRWSYETKYGWYWVPGYEWAPAWVAWRGGGDYYGWAPLSPGLNISAGASYGYRIPNNRWVFAPHKYITSRDISRYYVPPTRNITILRSTTVVNNVNFKNNVHFVSGPRREDVEKINHVKIATFKISSSSRPGKTVVNRNTVNVYRPVINNNTKVVVNNNDKTVINKNSNNTVNKNSNNTTVKKTDNTTVNNNSNNNTVNKTQENNTTVNKNKVTDKKTQINKTNNNKPQAKKQPLHPKQNGGDSNNKKKPGDQKK